MITCLTFAVGMHIGTAHTPGRPLNDFNPGAYVRCDQNVAGGFVNSLGKPSFYGARLVSLAPGVELSLGGITGYSKRVTPLAALHFRVGSTRVAFIPTTPANRGGLHLTREF